MCEIYSSNCTYINITKPPQASERAASARQFEEPLASNGTGLEFKAAPQSAATPAAAAARPVNSIPQSASKGSAAGTYPNYTQPLL